MSLTLQFILAMSCLIPAIPAAIKFRKTERIYQPFLLLIFMAVVTELVSDIPILKYESYDPLIVAHACYRIIEIYLMLLFYKRNDIFSSGILVWLIPLVGILSYAINYYFYQNVETDLVKYVSIGFTAINVILAIKLLGNQLFETKKHVLKNPKMIIAFGCTLYYSFYLLTAIFLKLGPQIDSLMGSIFSIHQIINVLIYLIFTWAILWIPTKQVF